MLTPFARRVISRIRCLNRSKTFGAITRLTSGPAVKLNPRNFRSCGRATALFASFTLRGWRSYFGFCETPEVLIGLTRWVRLRLRAAMWRQWKTPRRRRAALLELGVREPLASNTAGSGRGPWYLAKAKALSVGLSNAYFKSLGLPSLFEDC